MPRKEWTVEQAKDIHTLHDLQEWLEDCFRVGTEADERDFFLVQCPYYTDIRVCFDQDDDIDSIIEKTIEKFNDFDADERFTELWDKEFSKHNHCTPRQFITMLSSDEKTLHDIAFTLKTRFR